MKDPPLTTTTVWQSLRMVRRKVNVFDRQLCDITTGAGFTPAMHISDMMEDVAESINPIINTLHTSLPSKLWER